MNSTPHRSIPSAAMAMGFLGNRLNRDSENRDETSLRAALAHPRASLFLIHEGLWLCRETPAGPTLYFDVALGSSLADPAAETVLLGHDEDGVPHLATRAAQAPVPGSGVAALGLRALAFDGLLDPHTEGALAQAEHFLNWHARSRFCGRCGSATLSEAAGYRRRCPACGDMHFPRTDPVSIMMVHDGADRCLLGRSPRFPPGMWSCLAGFIEPGETLEDAVRRETFEEAGIRVGTVRYLGSQPWPFPGSLMIGCVGEATSFEITFDNVELEDCRWFDRIEVAAMLDGTHPDGLTAPKPFAIAHHLVRSFVAGDPVA